MGNTGDGVDIWPFSWFLRSEAPSWVGRAPTYRLWEGQLGLVAWTHNRHAHSRLDSGAGSRRSKGHRDLLLASVSVWLDGAPEQWQGTGLGEGVLSAAHGSAVPAAASV